MSAQWRRDRDWVLLLIKQLQARVAYLSGYTTQTATSGQVKTMAATDRVLIADTSGGTTATFNLVPGTTIGQPLFIKWWKGSVTKPTINAPTDTNLMEPFTGQTADGAAGLAAEADLNTPWKTGTWYWSGTYWLLSAP